VTKGKQTLEKVILSEKDKHHPRLKEAEWLFDYNTGLYE